MKVRAILIVMFLGSLTARPVLADGETEDFHRDLRRFVQSMDGQTQELQRLINMGSPYREDLARFLQGRSRIIEEFKSSLEYYDRKDVRKAKGVLELITAFGTNYDHNFTRSDQSAAEFLDKQLRVIEQLAGLYVSENPGEKLSLTRWVPNAEGDFTLARLDVTSEKGDVRKVLWTGKNQQQPHVIKAKFSLDVKEPLVVASLRRVVDGNGCRVLATTIPR